MSNKKRTDEIPLTINIKGTYTREGLLKELQNVISDLYQCSDEELSNHDFQLREIEGTSKLGQVYVSDSQCKYYSEL